MTIAGKWCVLALAALAAGCGDSTGSPSGVDAAADRPAPATDAVVVADTPIAPTDARAIDAGPPSPQCAAAIDINAMTAQADGSYVIRGSSIPAARTGGLTPPDGCLATRGAELVHQTIYRYRMRSRGRLFASTIRAGTDAMLDTAIVIAGACAPTAPSLACNDNRAEMVAVPGSLQSLARTSMELDAGTRVFISVGSASPTSGSGNREQSNYELEVFEATAVPEGGACVSNVQCDPNAFCFVIQGDTNGLCRVTGREGGYCRPERNCDPGLHLPGSERADGAPRHVLPRGISGRGLHGELHAMRRGQRLQP